MENNFDLIYNLDDGCCIISQWSCGFVILLYKILSWLGDNYTELTYLTLFANENRIVIWVEPDHKIQW